MTARVASPRTHFSFPFRYGDAAPRLLMECPAGVVVERVALLVTEPFDGAGPAVGVGDALDPGRLLSAQENLPAALGTYENCPALRYAIMTQLLLSVTPGAGATAGAGVITIDLTL